MIKLPIIAAAAVLSITALTGCEQVQRATAGAAVYQTVTNPAVPLQDKACAVLDWGVPIGQERAARADFTVNQRAWLQAAIDTGNAYCRGKDLRWQDRAVQAADTLSKVLWDIVK
jgi:hypothetical protein